jgi:cell division septation protein DedD
VDRSYNSLHDTDADQLPEREISLGTTTVLGIFFALALVCALFFGLGYSMGRRSTTPAVAASTTETAAAATSITKPSSGSPIASAPAPQPAPTTVTVPTTNTPPPPAPAEKSAAAATVVPTLFIVQIAAVSHREDAETLIANLKLRGYDVNIRQETQDKLLHVQIGPFTTRKDADAMRQHLLSDGYNAIVK